MVASAVAASATVSGDNINQGALHRLVVFVFVSHWTLRPLRHSGWSLRLGPLSQEKKKPAPK